MQYHYEDPKTAQMIQEIESIIKQMLDMEFIFECKYDIHRDRCIFQNIFFTIYISTYTIWPASLF